MIMMMMAILRSYMLQFELEVSSHSWGHRIMFLGKTLDSHSASLHSIGKINAVDYRYDNPGDDQHPIQGG